MKKRLITYATAAMLAVGTILTPTKSITQDQTQIHQCGASKFGPQIVQEIDYPNGWFYTLDEMDIIYEKEYEEGKKLDSYIKKEGDKYIGTMYGEEFDVPKEFIDSTLNQLEENLNKGYARHIFRLDAFHSHLFLPKELMSGKYSELIGVELTKETIKDKNMGALYHNTEHLALRNPPKIGPIDLEAQDLISKRSVLGWYDGRPLEQTHPDKNQPIKIQQSNSAGVPDGYSNATNLTFKSHKNGEFSIFHDGKEIKIDLSFDANSYY